MATKDEIGCGRGGGRLRAGFGRPHRTHMLCPGTHIEICRIKATAVGKIGIDAVPKHRAAVLASVTCPHGGVKLCRTQYREISMVEPISPEVVRSTCIHQF